MSLWEPFHPQTCAKGPETCVNRTCRGAAGQVIIELPKHTARLEVTTMKRTKLLALALAGVMALALLTGCSGGKSEDRRIAENVADIMKRSHPNVKEVSYSVPELSGAVRSAFAPGWLNEAGTGLERDALTQDGRTVEDFLKDSLKAYEERSTVYFFAFDATGESAYAQSERFVQGKAPSLPVFYQGVSITAYTKMRVGVCHKTVGEKDYCLVVLVLA